MTRQTQRVLGLSVLASFPVAACGAFGGTSSSVAPPTEAGSGGGIDATVEAATSADATAVDAEKDGGSDATKDVDLTPRPDSGKEAGADAGLYKRVFVTSAAYQIPHMAGGLASLDAACATEATNAALGGVWMAWVSGSDFGTDAKDRFKNDAGVFPTTGPWYSLSTPPVMVFPAGGPLVGLQPLVPITRSPSGTLPDLYVWTGTMYSGIATGNACTNWTVTTSTATVGRSGSSDGGAWVNAMEQACSTVGNHLYCLEK